MIIGLSSCQFTLRGEYLFANLANGTTSFPATSTSITMPTYMTPAAAGLGTAANTPAFDPRGLHIMKDDYLKSDSIVDTTANYYHMFGIWLYYIDGVIGEIVHQDIVFDSIDDPEDSAYFVISGIIDGTDQVIELCMHTACTTFGRIDPGWNCVGYGGDYEWPAYIICNTGGCYDGFTDSSFDYDDNFMPVYNDQRTLGCSTCSDTNVDYIIHSLAFHYTGFGVEEEKAIPYYFSYNSFFFDEACGDGTVISGEECDDGNTDDGDGCDNSCVLQEFCGDGITIGTVSGTYCDDGNTDSGDG